MASQGQDSIGHKAGQITGQAQVMNIPFSYYASYLQIHLWHYTFFFFFNYVNISPLIVQVKKDEFLNQASDTAQSAQNSSSNISGQATNFLQQASNWLQFLLLRNCKW